MLEKVKIFDFFIGRGAVDLSQCLVGFVLWYPDWSELTSIILFKLVEQILLEVDEGQVFLDFEGTGAQCLTISTFSKKINVPKCDFCVFCW